MTDEDNLEIGHGFQYILVEESLAPCCQQPHHSEPLQTILFSTRPSVRTFTEVDTLLPRTSKKPSASFAL